MEHIQTAEGLILKIYTEIITEAEKMSLDNVRKFLDIFKQKIGKIMVSSHPEGSALKEVEKIIKRRELEESVNEYKEIKLSKVEIDNLKTYFDNEEIAKIFFGKNGEKVIKKLDLENGIENLEDLYLKSYPVESSKNGNYKVVKAKIERFKQFVRQSFLDKDKLSEKYTIGELYYKGLISTGVILWIEEKFSKSKEEAFVIEIKDLLTEKQYLSRFGRMHHATHEFKALKFLIYGNPKNSTKY